jgi:hypothetical protein
MNQVTLKVGKKTVGSFSSFDSAFKCLERGLKRKTFWADVALEFLKTIFLVP